VLHWIKYLNFLIMILFFCCYSYQLAYIVIRFIKKLSVRPARKLHKYAILIAARNESRVIGELLDSISDQNYPGELITVFVVADNCTDETAEVSRRRGAVVFERHNMKKIGKGYALNYAFHEIQKRFGIDSYEGYLVLDADNVLDENYIREINNVFDAGYQIVTSYRNSKNFGYNWISAGYALWFLRESKYLNGARMLCRTSCAISGTGFLVSSDVIKKDNGWKYNLLTEDIEFSVDKIIHKYVIGYCETAVLYDEQPVSFKTSWNQRMRWTKGFYQVIRRYGVKLLRGCFKGKKFQCFDMLMTIAPATLLTLAMLLVNFWLVGYGLAFSRYRIIDTALAAIWDGICGVYLSLFFFGLVTTITEWKQIYCSAFKKFLYLFTFPVFMFTYVPISIAALFKKVSWEPIQHTFAQKVFEIRR